MSLEHRQPTGVPAESGYKEGQRELRRALDRAPERCLHTAEVAGSNPASPTLKNLGLQEKLSSREKESNSHADLFDTNPQGQF